MRINRLVVESDVTLLVGPVLPHEVIGFSGGNKYLFPGLSGQEMIDVTHWLGALITSSAIIGTRGVTPVRALVDAAADLVPGERHALCVVVDHESGRAGVAVLRGAPQVPGPPRPTWRRRRTSSHLDRPVQRVLSLIPTRYPDLWTGAKGFYKVEPIVADGGEVVLYAPHISEIAAMHPRLSEIGYHCRDYFLAQWDRYRGVPWASWRTRPISSAPGPTTLWRASTERVRVTLATGIPEDVVRQRQPRVPRPGRRGSPIAWAADPGTLVVPDAGEVLYRLR